MVRKHSAHPSDSLSCEAIFNMRVPWLMPVAYMSSLPLLLLINLSPSKSRES